MNERYVCRACFAVWLALESEDVQVTCPDCGASTWRIVSNDVHEFIRELEGQPTRRVNHYLDRLCGSIEATKRRLKL